MPYEWMPVFVVHEAMRTITGGFSKCEETPPGEELQVQKDVWQRVGTAFSRPEGGWDIRISVVPLNGRLVIRPPKPDEEPDAIPFLGR